MKVLDVSNATSNLVMGVGPLHRVGFILHSTSGTNSRKWLQGDSATSGNPSSADYLIGRDGETFRLVPPTHYAYHAGTSATISNANAGLTINREYFGIELENNDVAGEAPTDLQYQACAEIIRREAQINDMSPIKLYTHANIALPLGRRSDPVRCDIGRIFYYATYPTPFMAAT